MYLEMPLIGIRMVGWPAELQISQIQSFCCCVLFVFLFFREFFKFGGLSNSGRFQFRGTRQKTTRSGRAPSGAAAIRGGRRPDDELLGSMSCSDDELFGAMSCSGRIADAGPDRPYISAASCWTVHNQFSDCRLRWTTSCGAMAFTLHLHLP